MKKTVLQLLYISGVFLATFDIENFFLFLIFRYPIPPCDFSVKGVTSISVDVHKYGLAPKGTSVVLYRNHEIRKVVSFTEAFSPYFDWIGIVGVFTYIHTIYIQNLIYLDKKPRSRTQGIYNGNAKNKPKTQNNPQAQLQEGLQ